MRNRSSPSAQSDWIFLHPNALWIRDWTNCKKVGSVENMTYRNILMTKHGRVDKTSDTTGLWL